MLCLWLYSKGGMLCVVCHGISHATSTFDFLSCFSLTRYITCYITPFLGGHSRVTLQGLHRSGSPLALQTRKRTSGTVPSQDRSRPAIQRPGQSPAGNLPSAAREQIPGQLGPDGFKI